MKIRCLRIIAFSIPLIIGGFIYFIFRTERLIMFRWAEYLSLSDKIRIIQNLKSLAPLPNWFIYSLPDGLWMFSYSAISLDIWQYSITRQSFYWIFCIPVAAVLSEIFQLFKIIPGTFDFADIIFYSLGFILSYCTSTKIIFNTKKHEKH